MGARYDERKLPALSDVIAGKYRVEQIVASGGMGVVVLARHLHLEQLVAVKFLLPHMAQRGDIVSRFLREARAAVSLRGEHAVRVFDVGILETGAPYMVMEYLRGHDLDEELRREGARSVADAARWVLEACEAIAEAHALGIIHRDIKPANLFLARQPDGSRIVKVLDFGISKVADTGAQDLQKLTSTLTVLGSPQYMSPEQVRNARDVDARSDIWALGVVLYELVTDAPPFPAETVPALSAMIVSDPPAPMDAERVPLEFQAVILRCLEKEPTRRYQNILEFVSALVPFAPGSGNAAERIAGIVRGAGNSEHPPAPERIDSDRMRTRHRNRHAASPDAETVSAAEVPSAVSVKSAPSDGSTFSSTLESAKPRPMKRIAAAAAACALALAVLVVVFFHSVSPDAKPEGAPPSPRAAQTHSMPVEMESAEPAQVKDPNTVEPAEPVAERESVRDLSHATSERTAKSKKMPPREPNRSPLAPSASPAIRRIDPLGDRK